MLWSIATAAAGWVPGEVRPLTLPPASDLVLTPLDGAPSLVVTGPDGTRVLDPLTGQELVASPTPGRALLVAELDGAEPAEIVVCGPGGIALLRGGRSALAAPTVLSDSPCERIAAVTSGGAPELVSLAEGRISRWLPTVTGLVRVELFAGSALSSDGERIAALDEEGVLLSDPRGSDPQRIEGAARSVLLHGGHPVILRESTLVIGEEEVEATGERLVLAGGRPWVLDPAGKRAGLVEDLEVSWMTLPVAPRHLVVGPIDGDACGDLVVSDEGGAGALVLGVCEGPPTPPEVAERPLVRIPPVPATIELDGSWPVVDVRVGDVLATRVSGLDFARWYSRGGPEGFSVQSDGAVEWQPTADDVGRWRVPVRGSMGSRLFGKWYGFELRVWPAEGTVVDAGVAPAARVGSAPAQAEPSEFTVRSAHIGFGAAAGAAEAGGSAWENLGRNTVRGGVSPMASFVVATGSERVQMLLGADSAPFLTYGDQPKDRTYLVALMAGAQVSWAPTALGVYGTAGATVTGLGARVVWTGLEDWRGNPMGLEGRALWLAPKAGALGSLSWVWSL